MLIPFSSQSILLMMASWRHAVKSFGEMLSSCLAPLSRLILLLSLWSFSVDVAPLYKSLRIVMWAGSTP